MDFNLVRGDSSKVATAAQLLVPFKGIWDGGVCRSTRRSGRAGLGPFRPIAQKDLDRGVDLVVWQNMTDFLTYVASFLHAELSIAPLPA